MQLSPQQQDAFGKILAWFKVGSSQTFYLAGYAGTGKTTLVGQIIEQVMAAAKAEDKEPTILQAAYTGKAALQMRLKGAENARTIHSLIYRPHLDKAGKLQFSLNDESDLIGADLLILDECSMIDEKMGKDLLSFGVKVLIVGDPGQLPPIKGEGFFTKKEPDALLTEVHRQALESSIISIATGVRQGHALMKFQKHDAEVYCRPYAVEEMLSMDQVICGFNKTRKKFNDSARLFKGFYTPLPVKGDKIICLRNNREEGLFNGLIGYMEEDAEELGDTVKLTFKDDEGKKYFKVPVHRQCFIDPALLDKMDSRARFGKNEFDFGYAITCHKAQGSQWDSVCIIDDGLFKNFAQEQRPLWLYTAVTRAAKRMVITRGIN